MADVVTFDHTFGGLSSPIPTSYLDDNFGNVGDALADLNTFGNYLLDTGAVNAYVVTLAAGLSGALTNGLQIQVKIANENTDVSTLNYNGTGAKSIKNLDGTGVVPGQLPSGAIVNFVYSSAATSWLLTTPFGGSLQRFTGAIADNTSVDIVPNLIAGSCYSAIAGSTDANVYASASIMTQSAGMRIVDLGHGFFTFTSSGLTLRITLTGAGAGQTYRIGILKMF